MQEKRELYIKDGIIVEYQEDPYCVVIVTKLMQRAHQLEFAKDIAFVDSTASCDASGHSVTFILTACCIGAVPLAIIITKGQSEQDYIAGFKLLQSSLTNSFGGQGFPKIFVTDDSDAERNALKYIWPHSKTFLCRFHILQAVWRWLFEKKHNIDANDRRTLYNTFRDILIAEDTQNATELFSVATGNDPNEARNDPSNDPNDVSNSINIILGKDDPKFIVPKKYPQWIAYVKKYWERKEDWCMVFRDSTTHGHQTNNFCEVSVRLFKDIVLSRNKAYNVIALIDFTVICLEEYYQKRIRKFVNSRNETPRLILKNLLKKASSIKQEEILHMGQKIYKVPSTTKTSEFHYVDGTSGVCTCFTGKLGEFCKHQAAVYFYFNEEIVNAPAVTAESRYSMAKLAFGENIQPMSFYMPLVNPETKISKECDSSCDVNSNNIIHNELVSFNDSASSSKNLVDPINNSDQDFSEESLQDIFTLMQEHHKHFGTSSSTRKKVLQRLKSIKTRTSWESFLCTAGSSLSIRHRSNMNIKVQPTSISRRKVGITRGCKRLPIGRPPEHEPKSKKRKRKLAANVAKNQPNAKSHGSGH